MSGRSLLLRLSLAAGGLIAIALLLGGGALFLIFDAALDRRTADELNHTARFLAGQASVAADGEPAVERTPADPRYATPYGGLYWQIESASGALRSRSLWDKNLTSPARPAGELAHHATIDLAAPDGGTLLAVVRTVKLSTPADAPPLVIVVGMDRKQLAASRAVVERALPTSLVALGLALALAMAAFVHQALKPFRALRADLADVHAGRSARLGGRYPSEVEPLADDLNRLITLQEAALERAQAQAGDMAHGLKTPLAVLGALARRIEADRPDVAAEIDEQASAMDAQAARSLARARSAAAGAGLRKRSIAVGPVVGQLVSALRRLPSDAEIDWRTEIPEALAYPASEGELLEMLGNLVDNARKWAKGRIAVTGELLPAGGRIVVEDDGPGMADADMTAIGRGRRWDESTPGTGFGLAITRDLAEATGGRLDLARARLGGLRAAIMWESERR